MREAPGDVLLVVALKDDLRCASSKAGSTAASHDKPISELAPGLTSPPLGSSAPVY